MNTPARGKNYASTTVSLVNSVHENLDIFDIFNILINQQPGWDWQSIKAWTQPIDGNLGIMESGANTTSMPTTSRTNICPNNSFTNGDGATGKKTLNRKPLSENKIKSLGRTHKHIESVKNVSMVFSCIQGLISTKHGNIDKVSCSYI